MPTVLFTSETAREAQKLSAVAQRGIPKPRHKVSETLADGYQGRRLRRVREQLDRLDQMLLVETDPQKLDRLAAASMRLSDQEFALAGRAKPALAKAQAQPRRSQPRPEPVPIEPTTGSVPGQSQAPPTS